MIWPLYLYSEADMPVSTGGGEDPGFGGEQNMTKIQGPCGFLNLNSRGPKGIPDSN